MVTRPRPRATLGLARCYTLAPAHDPVDDQAAVFLWSLLPREVTRVERVDLAVGEEVVQALIVRPRHEVIVASRHDLGRRRHETSAAASKREPGPTPTALLPSPSRVPPCRSPG